MFSASFFFSQESKMIEIKRITAEHKDDINIPNEPFELHGRMIPTYDGKAWSYTTEEFPKNEVTTMVFPDEDYDYDEMAKEYVFIGAYDSGKCVGLAIYKRDWFKFLYLEDLKVSGEYRGRGVGRKLIAEGQKIAHEMGLIGQYTIGQDNNLNACLFYIGCGFEIGGLNTRVYEGTKQEGKSDIYFYLK